MIKNSVQCDKCGSLFDSDSKDFYTIEGNVYIGLEGGTIGNNFALDECGMTSVKSNHYCKPCLAKILGMDLQTNR